MICAIGFDSEHMAFTSRRILKWGDSNCRTNWIASAAVLMKLVSAEDNGSKQIVTARCSACFTGSRNAAVAQSSASLGVTPSRMFRCLGEPNTMILPPTSAQKSTRSHRYFEVFERTEASE